MRTPRRRKSRPAAKLANEIEIAINASPLQWAWLDMNEIQKDELWNRIANLAMMSLKTHVGQALAQRSRA